MVARRFRLAQDREPLDILRDEIPSRLALEGACLRTVAGKAMGPDKVPGELLKVGSGPVSKALYQLTLKMALRCHELVIFKGGTLVNAWKHKGAQSICSNQRALLISSVVGKSIHSVMRSSIVPCAQKAAAPMQVGGLPKYPVLYAAHAARLFISACGHGSFFMLYLDLKEAFYRVARPLLSSQPVQDEQLGKLFSDLQLPPQAFHAFREEVMRTSLVAQSGASEWTQAMLSEFLTETWYRMPAQEDLVAMTLGTRPGDCLADILFFFIFARVLRQVKGDIEVDVDAGFEWAEGMQDHIFDTAFRTTQTVRVNDVAWMDDLLIMSSCKDAGQIAGNLSRVAGCLVDRCLHMGMFPNLGSNKTEAIVGLKGKGAKLARKTLLAAKDPTLAISSQMWPDERLRIVATYKHLGGIVHHTGKLDKEVRARVGYGWTAFTRHKRTIFCQRHVGVHEKVILFQSLVLSTMLHGAGTWGEVKETTLAPINRAYIAMCRSMAAKHFAGDILHAGEDRGGPAAPASLDSLPTSLIPCVLC